MISNLVNMWLDSGHFGKEIKGLGLKCKPKGTVSYILK